MTTPDRQGDRAVERACAQAVAAADWLAGTDPQRRAAVLTALADAVDAAADELVPIARAESALPTARLTGEVARTSGQLRLFAEVVRDGACFEVTVDTARPDLAPPRPDLRRWLVGLGPVAVFGASNFPFAFSTLGNDTASALAAGCPVVVKTHPGHPRLTAATVAVARRALAEVAPEGVADGIVTAVGPDVETGVALVRDDRIEAVGFTGSARGGLALQRIAQDRPRPIPFYGELGSINPVFVTRAAAAARPREIAAGFVGSYTLGAGQYCTKPGLLVVPRGSGMRGAVVEAVAGVGAQAMLNPGVRAGFLAGLDHRLALPGVEVLLPGGVDPETAAVAPSLVAVPIGLTADVPDLLEECFGPTSLLVEYEDEAELADLARRLPGVLTATVAGEVGEPVLAELLPLLEARAGRVLWNGWPTGVAVTWSMQHGGPFPSATTALHTSVGAAAVRRFLRPVTWQGFPQDLLPEALRDANPWRLPRRVDGVLRLP
ncbi:MAG TPA: aldehyde dehydrogenase family protein [Kineosporiaceae bacterium]|nr:aldehyde dehydrogenase family protein [Kineosporiaceae bacterium]